MSDKANLTTVVLLAEDNPGDVLLVKYALKKYLPAFDLHVVRDGVEALAYIEKMQKGEEPSPGIVLLDLNLPKVSGTEVLDQLRKHSDCLDTPVVAITSSNTDEDRERMSRLGISHYFHKPTDLFQFMGLGLIVRELIESGAVVTDAQVEMLHHMNRIEELEKRVQDLENKLI